MLKSRLAIAAFALLLLGLFYKLATVSSTASQAAVPAEVGEGASVPDIALPTGKGSPPIKLTSLKGKVVILDFWATWCGPCRMSVPEVADLYRTYKSQGLQVVGVAVDDESTRQQVPSTANELGINYPIAYAADAPDLGHYFDYSSIPSMYLIDRQGKIAEHIAGYDPGGSLSDKVKALLKQ